MPRDLYWDIKVDDREVINFFEYAGYKTRDARDPLSKVAYEVIYPGIQIQFITEGARTGGWQSLSTMYEKQKAADGYGAKPILERTGAMKKDLLDISAFRVTRTSMHYHPRDTHRVAEYGSGEYAEYLQQGRYDEHYMPPRPWLVVTPEDERKIYDIFYEWLDELRTANRSRRGTAVYMGSIPQGWSLI